MMKAFLEIQNQSMVIIAMMIQNMNVNVLSVIAIKLQRVILFVLIVRMEFIKDE